MTASVAKVDRCAVCANHTFAESTVASDRLRFLISSDVPEYEKPTERLECGNGFYRKRIVCSAVVDGRHCQNLSPVADNVVVAVR